MVEPITTLQYTQTLLVADDKVDNLFVIEQLVEEYLPGCTVISTSDPRQVLGLVKTNMPEGIILDIQMPYVNGIELCKSLKSFPSTKHIPILLMTAHKSDPQIRAKGLDAGADDFITKPIDNLELAARIKVMFRVNSALVELQHAREDLEQKVAQRTSELMVANRLMRQEKERIQKYLDVAGVMFVVLNLSGEITKINKKGCEVLEGREQDVLNRHWFETFLPVDERNYYLQKFHEMVGGGSMLPPYYQHSIMTQNGNEKIISFHNTFLFDDENNLEAVLFSGLDITTQVESEKERKELQQKLQQAQKMEAIGALAGGIAHDFNNILSVIIGFTDLAIENVNSGTELEKDLSQVQEAGQRAKELVNQILAFSRQTEIEKIPLQLQPLIRETLKMLRSSIPTTIELQSRIDPSCGNVLADPTKINQILMNLCTNANHAMEKAGGILRVDLECIELAQESTLRQSVSIPPGSYAKLCVSDSGQGMESWVLDKLFDPYFTTKEIGKGTGMGLAITHGIVSEYNGAITVNSTLGEGSTFTIYLPVLDKKSLPILQEKKELPRGSERILVVDDELPLTEMLELMLGRLGYVVTSLQSSLDALELFKKEPHGFDAVITDQTMPKLTGVELAVEMFQIRPNLPVILCTGYSNQVDNVAAEKIGIKKFITKPISRHTLANALREVLNEDQ